MSYPYLTLKLNTFESRLSDITLTFLNKNQISVCMFQTIVVELFFKEIVQQC